MAPDQRMQIRGSSRATRRLRRARRTIRSIRGSRICMRRIRLASCFDPSSYRNGLSDGDYEKVIGWRQDVLKSASGNGGDKQVSMATIRGVTSTLAAANGLTTVGIKERDTAGGEALWSGSTMASRRRSSAGSSCGSGPIPGSLSPTRSSGRSRSGNSRRHASGTGQATSGLSVRAVVAIPSRCRGRTWSG